MKLIAKLAAAAALASTLAFVGPSATKDETIPNVLGQSLYAILHAENWPYQNGNPGEATFVQYEPRLRSGVSFGTSGLFAVDGTSTAALVYVSLGVTHLVHPDFGFTWATYTASTGPGNAAYLAYL